MDASSEAGILSSGRVPRERLSESAAVQSSVTKLTKSALGRARDWDFGRKAHCGENFLGGGPGALKPERDDSDVWILSLPEVLAEKIFDVLGRRWISNDRPIRLCQ